MLGLTRDAFISSLGISLVHSLWQGAIAGGIASILDKRLSDAPPQVRLRSYGLLLGSLFVCWIGTFGLLYVSQVGSATVEAVRAGIDLNAVDAFVADSGNRGLLGLRAVSPFLTSLWLIGVIALSIRHLFGLTELWRLGNVASKPCSSEIEETTKRLAARMGLKSGLFVRLCDRIDSPITFGILKSCILLPSSALMGLKPDQLEALIAHEIAHIRHRDFLLNLFQLCAETALFYHPAVWRLSAQIRVAREQRCDDLAIQAVGDHVLYARALFTMEELRQPIPHPALGAKGDNRTMKNKNENDSKSLLTGRIHRVLGVNGTENRRKSQGLLAIGAALICLGAIAPVIASTSSHGKDDKKSKVKMSVRVSKQNVNGVVTEQTNITASLNGKKVELDTLAPPTLDTPVQINGKSAKFGDLSAAEQKSLADALKHVTITTDRPFTTKEDHPLPPGTPGVHKQTKVSIQINGEKYETDTLDLKPDTKLKVNGETVVFGKLSQEQQDRIREALKHVEGGGLMHIESDQK